MHGKVIGVTGPVGKDQHSRRRCSAALERGRRGSAPFSRRATIMLACHSASLVCRAMTAGVFEMGMNHAGELSVLTRIVRPHVAIVTAIVRADEYFSAQRRRRSRQGEISRAEPAPRSSRSIARIAIR